MGKANNRQARGALFYSALLCIQHVKFVTVHTSTGCKHAIHVCLIIALRVAPAPKKQNAKKKKTQPASHDEDLSNAADVWVNLAPEPQKRKANERTTQAATEDTESNEVDLRDRDLLGKRRQEQEDATQDLIQEQQQRQQQAPGTRSRLLIRNPVQL
jgi:hypothetical protein